MAATNLETHISLRRKLGSHLPEDAKGGRRKRNGDRCFALQFPSRLSSWLISCSHTRRWSRKAAKEGEGGKKRVHHAGHCPKVGEARRLDGDRSPPWRWATRWAVVSAGAQGSRQRNFRRFKQGGKGNSCIGQGTAVSSALKRHVQEAIREMTEKKGKIAVSAQDGDLRLHIVV